MLPRQIQECSDGGTCSTTMCHHNQGSLNWCINKASVHRTNHALSYFKSGFTAPGPNV